MPAASRLIYRLKATLRGIDPPIWRRIHVWEHSTLAQLHHVLQIAFAWDDYHLHDFVIRRRVYSVPDPDDRLYGRKVLDEKRYKLREVVPGVGARFEYHYDFGDNWWHDIEIEGLLVPEAGTSYPTCTAGDRSAPPEDVGGKFGYQRYLEALADPEHEDHEEKLMWRGPFDPEAFSVEAVNRELRKRFRSTRRNPV